MKLRFIGIFFISLFCSVLFGDESQITNPKAQKEFKDIYSIAEKHKAFAQIANTWYWSSGKNSTKLAIESALFKCLVYRRWNHNTNECTVINVDDNWDSYTFHDLCRINSLTPIYDAKSGKLHEMSCVDAISDNISGFSISLINQDMVRLINTAYIGNLYIKDNALLKMVDDSEVAFLYVHDNASLEITGKANISHLSAYDNASIKIDDFSKISHTNLYNASHIDIYGGDLYLNLNDSATANIHKLTRGILFMQNTSINLYANNVAYENGKLSGYWKDGTPFSIEISEKNNIDGFYASPAAFPKQMTVRRPIGPSFDCVKASTNIEKMICSDTRLSELDMQTASTFKKILSKTKEPSIEAFKKIQNNWLKKKRNVCKDKKCVESAYKARIAELNDEFKPQDDIVEKYKKSQISIDKNSIKKYPFMPYLEYSADNELCDKMLKNHQERFFSAKIGEKPNLEYITWEQVYEDLGGQNRVGIEKIDLIFADNKTKPLIQWTVPHSWRGDNYKAVLYPSHEYFDDLIQNNSHDLSKIYDESTDMYPNLNVTNGVDINLSLYGSNWEGIDIFIHKNEYFFENWALNQKIATLKILEDNNVEAVCIIVKWKNMGDAPQLISQNFSKLRAALLNMSGIESGCSGTMNSQSEVLMRVREVFNKIVYMPWKESLYPYRDENIEYIPPLIEQWGYEGLWNYEVYKRYHSARDAAYNDLAEYYKKEFGMDDKTAKEIAVRNFAEMLSSYFNAHDYSIEPKTYDYLRKSLLLGKDVNDVETMLAGNWIKPVNAYDWPEIDEPTFFFSLKHPHLVELLLRKGADVNTTNLFGKTALMYAAQFNLKETAKILLKNGVNVNALTHDGSYPLCGYNISRRNVSALHYAVRYADADFIKLLLDNGANIHVKDGDEKTPFDWIELYKNENPYLKNNLDLIKKQLSIP
jgi:uncharacterized protein